MTKDKKQRSKSKKRNKTKKDATKRREPELSGRTL
jgi:hypothetical protein